MQNQHSEAEIASTISLEDAEGCWWREGGGGPLRYSEERDWLYFSGSGLVLQYPPMIWNEQEIRRRGWWGLHFRLLAPGRAEFVRIKPGVENTLVQSGQAPPAHGHFDFEVTGDQLVIRDQPEGCDAPRVFTFCRSDLSEAPEWFRQNVAADLQRRIDLAWPSP